MQKYLFLLTTILLPIFFLPLTLNFFNTPKLILLILTIVILVTYWSINIFKSKSITLSTSPLRFGLLGFIAVIIINVALYQSGRLESVTGPAGIYILLSMWAYFLSMDTSIITRRQVPNATILMSSILAIHTLLQLTLLHRFTFLPLYMQSKSFNLTGSLITTFIILAIGAFLSLHQAIKSKKPVFLATFILHTIIIVSLGYFIFPGHELATPILPLRASWSIALDSLKSIKTFFFGVGLTNFSIFYKSIKPLYLNLTPFWNITPSSSSSTLLQIITTTGILGLLAFISLPIIVLKKHHFSDPDLQPILILFITSFIGITFSPPSIPLLFIFFTSLGLLSAATPNTYSLSGLWTRSITICLLSILMLTSYQTVRLLIAEIHMRHAQVALSKNDGKTVYEQSLLALKLFPKMTSYRLSYSQVNLSLASALSQKKESLTDTERQNVSQLISQAIKEAKLAINLSPSDSTTWLNLGNIYKNMINVAGGANQFAIEAYAQAIATDPGNPAIRVEFGGLLYQIGQTTSKAEDQLALYDRSQTELQTAIQLKPDYANAYYNLSKLFETTKDYSSAVVNMQKTISYLGPNDPDLQKANAELAALESKLPDHPISETQNTKPGSLSRPSPLPSPISGGPIDLP